MDASVPDDKIIVDNVDDEFNSLIVRLTASVSTNECSFAIKLIQKMHKKSKYM